MLSKFRHRTQSGLDLLNPSLRRRLNPQFVILGITLEPWVEVAEFWLSGKQYSIERLALSPLIEPIELLDTV